VAWVEEVGADWVEEGRFTASRLFMCQAQR
jgi:hypothetical protein